MAKRKKKAAPEPSLRFSRVNLWFALGGLAAIALGYFVLGRGSITLAPVLLVVGYVVLLPLAIIIQRS